MREVGAVFEVAEEREAVALGNTFGGGEREGRARGDEEGERNGGETHGNSFGRFRAFRGMQPIPSSWN